MNDTCRYKFLVIDNAKLLEINNLKRKTNQAIKHPEPVMRLDTNRDGPYSTLNGVNLNVIYDEEERILKMWYVINDLSMKPGTAVIVDHPSRLAYAVSKDGINWERPELGIVEHKGSKKNNYLFPEMGIYGISVIKDPSDIPARRYKMIFGILGAEARWADFHVPLSIAYSEDGIHWDRPHHVNPVIRGVSDDPLSFFYDVDRRKYQLFTRRVPNLPRTISLYESYDLVNWEDKGRILVPGDENDPPEMSNVYYIAPFRYEDVYLAMFNTQYTAALSETYGALTKPPDWQETSEDSLGHMGIQLVYSRDGQNWNRAHERSAVITWGKAGDPDSGMIVPAKCPVVRDGETWIYYGANTALHCRWHMEELDRQGILPSNRNCYMLAKMPEDHWVSLDADKNQGSLVCKPWGPPHEIFINADAQGGSIEAELVTPYGKVVPDYSRSDCIPVTANGKNQQIKWKNGKSAWETIAKDHLGGLLVKFYLKNAKLYSYTFTLPDPDGQLERDRVNARWCDHIKHRSDNWDRNSNEPAIGLAPYTGPGPKE